MQYISPSKLKRFRSCPYQCKHEPFITSEAINFGSAIHNALAKSLKAKRDGKEIDVMKIYRGEAGKLCLPSTLEDEAESCIQFAEDFDINPDSIIEIESEHQKAKYHGNTFFEVQIRKDWGFRGAMDVVKVNDDGGLCIIDWKTGNSKEEDDLQLSIYAISAHIIYGEFPYIETIYAYNKQGFTDRKRWTKETLVHALEYVEPLANQYLDALKTNKWERTPHKWCSYCSLKDGCEAFQKQLAGKPDRASYDIEAIPENLPLIVEYSEKVKSVANAAYSIQKMLDEKRNKILENCNNKLSLNGKTYVLKQKVSRYNYDLKEIFAGVQDVIGRPPLELCEYSSGGLKELKKTLDKDQKKSVDKVIKNNREIKTHSKSFSVSIAQEETAKVESNEKKPVELTTFYYACATCVNGKVINKAEDSKEECEKCGGAMFLCEDEKDMVSKMELIRMSLPEHTHGVCKDCLTISEFHNGLDNSRVCCKCKGSEFYLCASLKEAREIEKRFQPDKAA